MNGELLQDEALLDSVLALHGLGIDPSWRVGILANLAAIGRAADLVMSLDIDEAIEPAPVYQASTR